jgi:hypothetical protein
MPSLGRRGILVITQKCVLRGSVGIATFAPKIGPNLSDVMLGEETHHEYITKHRLWDINIVLPTR